ncbi:hypothetical protein PHET_04722 [Paragonimus heterotremus]|uniref:Calponin-homology (CH) domain-containing protein n=1 Tax=Paragonimus heterotremus TaxID=100268 RepID=A0A8J4SZT5_9TREM|nr:hypothetical protein PHET_04722 [Paragonimus heterotremus]
MLTFADAQPDGDMSTSMTVFNSCDDYRLPSSRFSPNDVLETTEDTYLQWINKHLAKASPPMVIEDITEANVCNGIAIGLLLETIGDIKLDGLLLQPGTRVERLHNVHEVFAVLRRLKVRLDNLQPEDIMNGDRQSIMQMLLALSTHFMTNTRGRRSYNRTPSPQLSSRRTPTGRRTPLHPSWGSSINFIPRTCTPSEHYTEISNPQYSHQIIGPTVYTSDNSGKSSPRSRSTMTMMFSGQRSPTSMLRSTSRSSEASDSHTPADIRVPKPRQSTSSQMGDGGPYNSRNFDSNLRAATLPISRTAPALPHYIESMNELSHLKSQLNTISRLISSDSTELSPSLQNTMFPTKAVQTDPNRDLINEMQQAQRQIDELTRMLHAKDLALRQKEQENIRLNEVLHSLQRTIRHGGTIPNSAAGDPHSAVPTDHSRRQQQEFRGSHSHKRRSPEHSTASYAHSHSYDPRPDGSVHHNRTDQPRKPRSKSREKIRQSSPGRLRNSATNSRPEAVHVKKMSVNLGESLRSNHGEHTIHSGGRY